MPRAKVLWALQYDRRPDDLALVRGSPPRRRSAAREAPFSARLDEDPLAWVERATFAGRPERPARSWTGGRPVVNWDGHLAARVATGWPFCGDCAETAHAQRESRRSPETAWDIGARPVGRLRTPTVLAVAGQRPCSSPACAVGRPDPRVHQADRVLPGCTRPRMVRGHPCHAVARDYWRSRVRHVPVARDRRVPAGRRWSGSRCRRQRRPPRGHRRPHRRPPVLVPRTYWLRQVLGPHLHRQAGLHFPRFAGGDADGDCDGDLGHERGRRPVVWRATETAPSPAAAGHRGLAGLHRARRPE